MLHRIRQLYKALTAKITDKEKTWVNFALPPKLQGLFYGMDLVDQRHSLDAAAHALARCGPEADEDLLIQAALLHDCGKVRGSLRIIDRVGIVLLTKLLGNRSRAWAKTRRPFARALTSYFEHPRLGAELVGQQGGCRELMALIARHHEVLDVDSSLEARLLFTADQAN